jgi:hypothetical protein
MMRLKPSQPNKPKRGRVGTRRARPVETWGPPLHLYGIIFLIPAVRFGIGRPYLHVQWLSNHHRLRWAKWPSPVRLSFLSRVPYNKRNQDQSPTEIPGTSSLLCAPRLQSTSIGSVKDTNQQHMAEANRGQIHRRVVEEEKIIIDTDPGIGAYGHCLFLPPFLDLNPLLNVRCVRHASWVLKFRGCNFVSLESGLPRIVLGIHTTSIIPLY